MPRPAPEWFDAPGPASSAPGLRFACTMCGNCCTGPEGYVLFTPDEAAAMADRLGISLEAFIRDCTRDSPMGRSLRERPSPFGLDCIFLDRTSSPGRALCGVYEARPAQCRTWPFWTSNLRSRAHWQRAGRTCPGIDRGALIPPERIRILRATVDR